MDFFATNPIGLSGIPNGFYGYNPIHNTCINNNYGQNGVFNNPVSSN
jgi:hypothetical protein